MRRFVAAVGLLLALAAPGVGAADARRAVIPFDQGEPASLWWDAKESALYVADNEGNRIWRWTDAGGLASFAQTAETPGAPDPRSGLVGQIVRRADGTFVVMRFGKPGGAFGGIAYLNPASHVSALVPDLDPQRKRIGLAVAPDGSLFGSYFQAAAGGPEGAVTRVDLATGETDFAGGFKKIVGVLVDGERLYVSDQAADAIYVLPLAGPLPAPGSYTVLARLPRPDQLALGPDGSLFTGQFQGAPGSTASLAVRQILRDGTVKTFVQDPDVTRPSGLAYDAAGRRLFVANGGNPAQRSVRVFPVP